MKVQMNKQTLAISCPTRKSVKKVCLQFASLQHSENKCCNKNVNINTSIGETLQELQLNTLIHCPNMAIFSFAACCGKVLLHIPILWKLVSQKKKKRYVQQVACTMQINFCSCSTYICL